MKSIRVGDGNDDDDFSFQMCIDFPEKSSFSVHCLSEDTITFSLGC